MQVRDNPGSINNSISWINGPMHQWSHAQMVSVSVSKRCLSLRVFRPGEDYFGNRKLHHCFGFLINSRHGQRDVSSIIAGA